MGLALHKFNFLVIQYYQCITSSQFDYCYYTRLNDTKLLPPQTPTIQTTGTIRLSEQNFVGHAAIFEMVLVRKTPTSTTLKRSNFYVTIALGLFCVWKASLFTASKLGADNRCFSEVLKIEMYEQNRLLGRLIFIIKALPCYLLIIFGCFCLGKLGYDLISFNDLPNEIHKLEEVYPTLISRI